MLNRYQILFISTVFVTILNDTWLKYSDLLPAFVTGKLSDICGLYFFPQLLSHLANLKTTGATAIYLLTAILFSFLKLSDTGADFIESLFSFGEIYSIKIWSDPTDLLALVIMPLSFYFFKKKVSDEEVNETHKNFLNFFFLATAIFATLNSGSAPDTYKPRSYTPLIFGYNDNQFREAIELKSLKTAIANSKTLVFANPSYHRLVEIEVDATINQPSKFRALYNDGVSFGWHTADLAGTTGELNTPIDIAVIFNPLTAEPEEIWILDLNGISRRSYIDGTLLFTLAPANVNCQNVSRIEYSDHLITLSQNNSQYYLCHYDNSGIFLNSDLIPMVQVETGATVTAISDFKAMIDGLYIMSQLQNFNTNDPQPYFLAKYNTTFLFQSGVFLYDASGMVLTNDAISVTGRLRNCTSMFYLFDYNLDQIAWFDMIPNPVAPLSGAMFYSTRFKAFPVIYNNYNDIQSLK